MESTDTSPELQPSIAWLSDSYRLRLQQEEKDRLTHVHADKSDSFLLCPKDHVDTYAEHRVLQSRSEHGNKPRRPPSAAAGPRQLGQVREALSSVEWEGWAWTRGGEGQETAEGGKDGPDGRHISLASQCEGQENVDKGHALWLAAKRKHAHSRPTSARLIHSRSPRSSSALGLKRNDNALPPRPSSAMALRPNDSLPPRPSSAMSLNPNDSLPPRPSSAMSLNPNDSLPPRPSSAMSLNPNDSLPQRPSSAMAQNPHDSLPSRPSSAMSLHLNDNTPLSPRPASPMAFHPSNKPFSKATPTSTVYTRRELTQRGSSLKTQSRPSSASAKPPTGRVDPYTVREKRLRALHEAWTQDPRSGLHIGSPGAVGPDPHLMDRHARCLQHQTWTPPGDLPERPHTSCGLMRTEEGGGEGQEVKEEDDALEALLQQQQAERDGMSRLQRYVDCHRPSSAPRMRKELEGSFRRSVGMRGRSPHFCNFVQKAGLHARYDTGQARTGSGNDVDDGRDSLSSEATDGDVLAQWRKSRITSSGTEGRPASPTSLNGRSRDPNVTSVLNGAASEDEDTLSAKMIPTITIPSSPIPPGDQMLSNRSSGESSPRKSAREEPRQPEPPAEKSPKPQALAVSVPTPPPKEEKKAEKGKRLPVSKKTRKGGDKRRKSKAASMEPVPVETSGSGEPAASGDAESQPTPNGLDVKAVVPDLPEVSSAGKKNGKQGKKGQRRLISTPPAGGEKLQLPQELLDIDSNSRTGYDFGDLGSTLTDNLNNKYRPQNWLHTRMALSQQASRFELPMDMKVLEKITPQDYLRKFCVVSSRRNNLYQKIFLRYKDKNNTINKEGLETCLKETLVQQLKENTFPDLCDLLDIRDDTVIDFKLFSGAAAITERILYPCYTTEDTVEKPEYQREKIETADFGALDWKLHGIQVGDKMRRLLKTIE